MSRQAGIAAFGGQSPAGGAPPAGGATHAGGGTEAEQGPTFPGCPALEGLTANDGRHWARLRTQLAPRYQIVRRDMAAFALLTVTGLSLHGTLTAGLGGNVGIALAPVVGLWIGYWMAGLICFMHEAAHYNLHPDKRTNDWLADVFLCPLVGEEIRHYRALHWRHHLHLGTTEDTEVSYRHAPTPRFLLEAATGVHALRVLAAKFTRPTAGKPETTAPPPVRATARAAVLHLGVVTLLVAVGLPSTALAWAFGVVAFYPFFNTLRQLLEHRSLDARPDVDYALVEHGAVNRMFGHGILARTFGAAGFNRHLLHHWHPAASYTRFDDLEDFFLRTGLKPEIESARTTYPEAFRRLARASRSSAP